MSVGPAPTLVLIRGNSGSGKSTAAREVRRRYGRGAALIEQDYLRRVVLREHGGGADAVAPGFVTRMAGAALAAGYHVILEGILHTRQYAGPLRQLVAEHRGPGAVFYLDVSFDETVRRHLRREQRVRVSAGQMRDWYTERDLLGVPGEHVIPEGPTADEVVTTILHTSGLGRAAALTPCPARCSRCAEKAAQPPDAHPRPPSRQPSQSRQEPSRQERSSQESSSRKSSRAKQPPRYT